MFGTVCKQFIIFIPRFRLCLGQCVKQFIIFIPRFGICLGQCENNLLFLYRDSEYVWDSV